MTPREAIGATIKIMDDQVHVGHTMEELIEIILTDPLTTAWFASDVVGGQFKRGEGIIATCGKAAYYYARFSIRRAFIPGEHLIAKLATESCNYAIHVLNGRFTLGEPVIAKNPTYAVRYAEMVLRGRFFLGEKHLHTDAYNTSRYLGLFPDAAESLADS